MSGLSTSKLASMSFSYVPYMLAFIGIPVLIILYLCYSKIQKYIKNKKEHL